MAGFDRIGALTEELRRVAKDLERGFARYGEVLSELQGIGLPAEVASAKRGPGRPRGRRRIVVTARRGRGRSGTLTQQVIDFLAKKPGESFLPRQIADELGLADKRRRTLSTTLFLLGRKKRIRKAAKGYSAAS
jgi:hypothetical protein